MSGKSPAPSALGYRMPAEWELHEATWLSWPHNRETWPDDLERITDLFARFVGTLAESELVRINVADESMASDVESLLRGQGVHPESVRFHHNPTNDAWVRDHGPVYVVREGASDPDRNPVFQENRASGRAIVDWDYNAWGHKYPPFDLDNAIPAHIADEFGEQRFAPGIVLEGGSIDVNGRGALLTTESCLLNPNRNPHLDQSAIELFLRDYLGVRHILWLGDGIVGDDTDGHVDDITRFVSPDTVVTAIEEDPHDENYQPLRDNLHRLQSMTDQEGHPLHVVTLPMPGPVFLNGERLPASYANFYIANRRVLVPVFGHDNDSPALETLQRLFPDRLVLGIDCTDLVKGLGAIHCVTQQQPSG